MSRKKQGFTIVELLMATLTMAILILAVGHVLFYSWLGWINNTRSVNMKRDAYLAMEQIAREIRNSNIADISADSSGIYFSSVVARTNSLDILAADIAVFPNVNIVDFDAQPADLDTDGIDDGYTISFTLFTDGNTDRNDYKMTVQTRN